MPLSLSGLLASVFSSSGRYLPGLSGLAAGALATAVFLLPQSPLVVRLTDAPVLRDSGGRPRLDGVWRGPELNRLDFPSPGFQLPDDLLALQQALGRTATGFPYSGRLSTLASLRVDSGIAMHHHARLALRRRDLTRLSRSEADSWLDRNTWERCLTRGLPPAALPEPHASYWQFFQTPALLAILSEALHEVRFVPFGSASSGPRPVAWLGSSVGTWHADTLEIVTTRIRQAGSVPAADPLPGRHPGPGGSLRLVERLTPLGYSRIRYSIAVHDPDIYYRPIRYAFVLVRALPSTRLYETACHEGNRAMIGILRGARAHPARSRFWSAAGVALRAWRGHPAQAAPSRRLLPPQRLALPASAPS